MKISFLLPGSPKYPSGGYKVVYEYANFLAEKGHNVIIYYDMRHTLTRFMLPDYLRRKLTNIIVHIRPKWFKLDKKIRKVSLNTIENKNFIDSDIIIATAVSTAPIVYNLPFCKGKKFYFIQGYEIWNCDKSIVINTYKYSMINITVSKWLQNIVYEHTGSKPILLKNGIDRNIFKIFVMPDKRKLHSIVFHYRKAEMKGSQYSIDVVVKLKNIYPDLIVDVVGIEDRPRELPDFCRYHRGINAYEVSNINNMSTIFLCSSIEEGFGLPGLEAMACGCVLVSTIYEGVLEYAVNEENALLSEIKNVDKLTENIERVFSDSDLREKLLRNSIVTANNFSLEKAAADFETILKYSC